MISKSLAHKLLEIKLLQNSLYGRLSRRRRINERAKARLDWKFEAAFGLLEVLDRLVSTVGAISLGQGY